MSRISSDVTAAHGAVAGVKSVETGKKTGIEFKQSNISSMTNGKDLANQMLDDLSKLVECVKGQAGKFTQLAAVRQDLDAADQAQFKN